GASDAVMGLAGVTDLQSPGQRRVSAGEVDHVLIAVAVPRYARDARKQVVGQLEVIAGTHIDALVGSGRQVDVAGIGAFGLLADQTHHAADGAAAKQRALRPAQDFHTVHVNEVHLRAHGAGLRDVVHVDADTRPESRAEGLLPDHGDA